MNYEKSPVVKLEEINVVSKVVDLFFEESGDPDLTYRLLEPFTEWLFDKAIEAMSEEE